MGIHAGDSLTYTMIGKPPVVIQHSWHLKFRRIDGNLELSHANLPSNAQKIQPSLTRTTTPTRVIWDMMFHPVSWRKKFYIELTP